MKGGTKTTMFNPITPSVSELREGLGGGTLCPPLDIDQIMDFANSVFTGA